MPTRHLQDLFEDHLGRLRPARRTGQGDGPRQPLVLRPPKGRTPRQQLARQAAGTLTESGDCCADQAADTIGHRGGRPPDVHCETPWISGHPAHGLVLAEYADLVVGGSRGRDGFTGPVVGLVSQNVLHHAYCPVSIVR